MKTNTPSADQSTQSQEQANGSSTPLFPAGALARYVHDEYQPVSIDDLQLKKDASGTASTDAGLNVLDDTRFSNVAKFIDYCVTDYLDKVVSYQYENYAVTHAWLNRASEGAFQGMHTHGNSIVSGVYYLQASSNNAPLIFEKTEANSAPYFAIAPREQTLYNSNRMALPPKSGTCFLFPSNIRHGYDIPNQGKDRISLAFNVMLTGLGRFYQM